MYEPVLIYSLAGDLLGQGIKDDKAYKLQTTNIYLEGEGDALAQQLARLNEKVGIVAHWPSQDDPEVQALLDDTSFMPLSMIEAEVVDDEASDFVYIKDPIVGDYMDEEASKIVLKKMLVPANPSDKIERIKAACEAIAKKRALTTA